MSVGLAAEKVVNGQGGLRNILFSMMMKQEVAYHDLVGSGKILTRFSSDTELVKDAFQIYFPLVFEASSAVRSSPLSLSGFHSLS